MRYVCSTVAAVVALSILTPFGASGQSSGLSITNYQMVSEERLTRTESNFTYRADIVNAGAARSAVTATVTSRVPSVQIVQGTLHFMPVPANSQVPSSDTFVIRVDRTVAIDFATALQWTFSSPASPIANAGPNQTAVVGSTVTLNGSGSSNPSGIGTLTYNWAFTSRPAGSTAVLSNPASVMPTFVIDRPGSYVIALTVSNGTASDTASVTVSTANTPPVANAGPNQTVAVGATVALNGSSSSDVDGDPLTYAWTLITRPTGSSATLNNAASVMPTFVADRAGTYVAQLVVNDGKVNSNPAMVTITTQNTPPVANAGPNQSVNVGAVVQLNGSASTDVDGDSLTYQWSLITVPAGSPATLSSATAVNPTFTADRAGTYVAQLIVNDGKVNSAPVTVTITTNAVQAPTANAGPNQTVRHGATVTLNGSGTDPQSLPLTFQWSFTTRPAGSNAVLSSPTSANPTFVADQPGNYVLQLIVSNGTQSSAPATVTITTTNTAPVANPGPSQTVSVGALVALNGSGSSDADGDALSFSWTFTSRPAGSTAQLSAATSPTPTFVADVAGAYVVQLIVNDGFTNSAPATVTITTVGVLAITTASLPNGTVGTPYSQTLAATGGTAPYTFAVTSGALPAGLSLNATTGQISGTPTAVVTSTPLTIRVTDANGQTATANLTLTITNQNPASITATSGTGQSAAINTAFGAPLVATVTDASGNPVSGVTVTFAAPASGPSGTFAGGVNTAVTNASGVATSPVFTANSAAGSFTITASAAGVAAAASFSLTNTAGTASSITATSGTPQSAQVNAAFATPLVATVRDAGGNPVSGVTVTFTVSGTGAGGTFAGGVNTAVTNAAGVATSTVFTANGNAGSYTVNATAPGVATPAAFALTNTVGAPSSISATSGAGQSAQINTAFSAPLVATVRDAANNPVSGITVTFAAPGTGASGTFAGGANTAVTNASGIATSATFTANSTSGAYSVTASAGGVSTTFSLSNTPGPAGSITSTSGTGQSTQINTAFSAPLVATVRDAGGNPVSGVTVTFTAPPSGASGSFAGGVNTAVTDASGVATSPAFSANGTIGSYTVTASAPGVATAASFTLTNTSGPAASITATSGSGQNAQINAPFGAPLVATVRDAGGNPVSGATVTFAAPASGASGTFAGGVNTAITNASGVATSAVFAANGTIGSYTVSASVPGVATAASFALTNTTGPAASITATSGSGQSVPTNTAFGAPLVATVRDAGGNPVSGVTVTFAAPASGASGTFAGGANTAVTNASGVATSATFTANGTGGSYVVTASAAGVATPASFSLSNTGGTPSSITATGGTPQAADAGSAFASPLLATVLDANGNPVSGVTVTFTAPGGGGASATFAGGSNIATAVTNASGVAASPAFTANSTAGTYSVSASVPGTSSPASFALTNRPVVVGPAIAISNATVGRALQAPVAITIPQAAPPGGLRVTIASTNSALVLVAGRPGDAGTPSIVVTIPEGLNTVGGIFVQGLASSGTAQVTASASGYSTGTATITLAPSGFILTGPNGPGVPSFTTPQNVTTTLTVLPVRLDSSMNFVENQAVAGGTSVTVSISNTNPGIGTVTPASVTLNGGDATAAVTFRAQATGSTTLTAEVPAGFALPAGGANSLTANVTPTGISASDVTVGQNLQTTTILTLNGAAPSGGITVTLTSSDPAKLLFSRTATGTGTPSITLDIQEGRTTSPEFYVQGLGNSGVVTYSITATGGFGSSTGNVNLRPSGFVLNGPFGLGANFLTTTGAANTDLTLFSALLSESLGIVAEQQVRGGITVNVPVTSSNTAVGTITTSPVVFTGGSSSATTQFRPVGEGDTTITAATPAGFSTPAAAASLTASVRRPALNVDDGLVIGRNLQQIATVLLGQPAPTGGLPVTLTSNSGSLLLSTSATAAGSGSITITVPVGQSSANFYLQSLASSGTVTYSASAPGYTSRTASVGLAPSGIVIAGPFGFGFPLSTNVGAGPQPVTVFTALLDPATNGYVASQPLAGGMTLSVSLTNSNPAVGTVTTPVTISANSDNGVAQFNPLAVGQTTIAVVQPAGYTTPSNNTVLTVRVN